MPLPPEILTPHPDRLDPQVPAYDEIMAAYETAVRRSRPRYRDPRSGLWVMTAARLWARGYCCDSGCRHCPYLKR